jgi:hypothetical protein
VNALLRPNASWEMWLRAACARAYRISGQPRMCVRLSLGAPRSHAFHLSTTHRLVLAAAVTPMPRLPNKQIDWAKVTVLEVIEIY